VAAFIITENASGLPGFIGGTYCITWLKSTSFNVSCIS